MTLAALIGLIARAKRIPLAALAGSFVAIDTDSVTRLSTRMAGRLYILVCDDVLISMRYARNFAEGRGLVYNVGEAVDGFTNPLWTALMVLPLVGGLHEGIATMPVVIMGGALLLATALLVRSVLAMLEAPGPLQWLPRSRCSTTPRISNTRWRSSRRPS